MHFRQLVHNFKYLLITIYYTTTTKKDMAPFEGPFLSARSMTSECAVELHPLSIEDADAV